MRVRKKLLSSLILACIFIGISHIIAFAEGIEDIRQIGTVEELIIFANDVNAGQTSLNGELTADIDLTGKEWIPIGTTSNKYIGNFNGNGYRIKNMIIDSTEQYQGFFGVVSGGIVVENLIIDKSCSIKGSAFCAGIIGGSNGSGTVTIQNCGNEADVTGTAQNIAGIIGVNNGSYSTYIIKNCYNTGNISGSKESAAISGWLGNNALVENCYNTGSISGIQSGHSFARFSSATFNNCYQLDTVAKQTDIISFTVASISSGELAYNLGDDWGQTIGSDEAPILGGKKVYLGYKDTCVKIYSNTELNSEQPPHDESYNNKEQCGVCGDWHPESVYIKGLDLTLVTEDMGGYNWSWNNANKELTLNGLNINTTSSAGIKLPDGSKVILNDGTENNISVIDESAYGILCVGNIAIKGNGSLNITANGGDAIRCENNGADAGLTIEDVQVTVNGKINIPSTNKNSSLIINNSTVNTVGTGRNRIEVLSGSESTRTEFVVKNSKVTCGFLNVQDTKKTGNLIFCVEESYLDAEMNETSIMSSAVQVSGKDVDVDITNSYIRAYTRCGAWGWGHSYASRIDGTGNLDLNITCSDMLLYGTNRGLNVNTSGTLSSESAIENCTIISYAKRDDGEISIGDNTGDLTDTTVDDSIVFVYGNTQNNSSTPNYSAEIIGSPTISYNFELPEGLGSTDLTEVTPDLVLDNGQTLTVVEGVVLKLPNEVSVKISENAAIKGGVIGTIIAADDSIGILIFDYGYLVDARTFNINGEVVEAPQQNPTKLCQIVEGWYDDEEYKIQHDFTKLLTNNTTIYAKWVDNHSFTDYKSNNNATCTADGTQTATCDNCKETDTVVEVGTMLEHTYESKITMQATCEKDGIKTYTCKNCKDTYIESIVAIGHSFTNYVSNKDATCTSGGTKTAVCNHEGCDKMDKIADEGSKLSHTPLKERKNVKEATYTEEGYTGDVVCADCEEILEKGEVIKKKLQAEEPEDDENNENINMPEYDENNEDINKTEDNKSDEKIENAEDSKSDEEIIGKEDETDDNKISEIENSELPKTGENDTILWLVIIFIIAIILIGIIIYRKNVKNKY